MFGWTACDPDGLDQGPILISCPLWEKLMLSFSTCVKLIKQNGTSCLPFSALEDGSIEGRHAPDFTPKMVQALKGLRECKETLLAWTNLVPETVEHVGPALDRAFYSCLELVVVSLTHAAILGDRPPVSPFDALPWLRALYDLTNCEYNRDVKTMQPRCRPLYDSILALNIHFSCELAFHAAAYFEEKENYDQAARALAWLQKGIESNQSVYKQTEVGAAEQPRAGVQRRIDALIKHKQRVAYVASKLKIPSAAAPTAYLDLSLLPEAATLPKFIDDTAPTALVTPAVEPQTEGY